MKQLAGSAEMARTFPELTFDFVYLFKRFQRSIIMLSFTFTFKGFRCLVLLVDFARGKLSLWCLNFENPIFIMQIQYKITKAFSRHDDLAKN